MKKFLCLIALILIIIPFASCNNSDNVSIYLKEDENGFVFYDNGNDSECYLYSYKGYEDNLVLPENYNGHSYYVGEAAFHDYSCKTITIPDSVTKICGGAFELNERLRTVTIGDGVKEIESGAFDGCSNLETVTIGSGVDIINKRVFRRCQSLISVSFKNQSYWYLVDDEYNTTPADLSDAENNASNLKSSWANRYLYRFDEEI